MQNVIKMFERSRVRMLNQQNLLDTIGTMVTSYCKQVHNHLTFDLLKVKVSLLLMQIARRTIFSYYLPTPTWPYDHTTRHDTMRHAPGKTMQKQKN